MSVMISIPASFPVRIDPATTADEITTEMVLDAIREQYGSEVHVTITGDEHFDPEEWEVLG